ncbi:MAG: GNAT family N-acetyltransferase [Ignavibacteriales bacterium]|nr:GNAT family N-acetyltransferase [Ignavibacteriales bacterium]
MISKIEHPTQSPVQSQKPDSIHIKRQMRIVGSTTDFDALENDWTKLFNESDVTIYQSYEWLRTWWKYFVKPNFKLHILVFYCDDKIEGIAPLFLETVKIAGIPVAKRLQFLGRGLSDYVNFIILPGHEDYLFERFANYLASSGSAWNLFDIEDVNEETQTVQHFPRFTEKYRLKLIKYQGNICPQVSLPNSPDLLIENMGSTSRHNFKRKVKKLQSNYHTSIDLYTRETDNLQKAIDEFSDIHGKRWKSLGHPSAFDSSMHKEFHLEFSKKFAHNGWLRIYILRINNEPVATSYGFYFKKRMYMYQSNAYGTEDVMRFSPGLFLRSIVMADGIKENMEVFDYMRGDEPYKFSEWEATFRKNYLLRIKPNRISRSPGFWLYLLYELGGKCRNRVKKEYYEYRRFLLTKPRSITDRTKYIFMIMCNLTRLGLNFIGRHSPVEKRKNINEMNQ